MLRTPINLRHQASAGGPRGALGHKGAGAPCEVLMSAIFEKVSATSDQGISGRVHLLQKHEGL